MEEPPAESLGPESTAKSPDDSRTDGQQDTWRDQDEEEVDEQTDPRTAEQAAQGMSGQTDRRESEPPGRQASDQGDQRAHGQTDGSTSSQTGPGGAQETNSQMFPPLEQRTDGQMERRRPSQAEGRASGQTRRSSQTERRAYEQINHGPSTQSSQRTSEQVVGRSSVAPEQGAPEQVGHRTSSQDDRRTSEQIGSRLSGLVERRTSEKTGHRPSIQGDPRTLIKTYQDVDEEAPELVEEQAAEQAHSSAQHLAADKDDGSDQADPLMDGENYKEDYLADYGAPGPYDDKIFSQLGYSKEYKEPEPRIEPCKFETEEIDGDNSWTSAESDTESVTHLKGLDACDARFTSNLQAKDQFYSQRFPCISSKLDYIISGEKTEAAETKPDEISEYQGGRKSFGYNQTYRRQFPPIVYEDPYQVSLRYMEKHHILQIFQVQEMIENRDKSETYRE